MFADRLRIPYWIVRMMGGTMVCLICTRLITLFAHLATLLLYNPAQIQETFSHTIEDMEVRDVVRGLVRDLVIHERV